MVPCSVFSFYSFTQRYEHGLHPTQINTWKKEFLDNATVVFEKEGSVDSADQEQLIQTLYAQIGELKVANDFLKKKSL